MNEQKIHELLRSYFDGTSSLAEDRELRRFFAEEQVPDSLRPYRPLFAYIAEERAVEPPAKVEAKIVRLPWIIVTGIAASIAILFLIGLPKITQAEFVYYVDGQRVYDEEAAMESAEDKLQLLAASIQKAKTSMSAFETVRESTQSLQQLNKIPDAYRQAEDILSGFKTAGTESVQ